MHLVQDVEKAEVKIEIPPPSAGGDTAPHILVATSWLSSACFHL